MLYTALNTTTDEIFASNSFKTIYEAVMTNLTYALPSLSDMWIIKRHSNLDIDNFSFQDVVFSGEEIYSIFPTMHNIIVNRFSDDTQFIFRARYYRSGFDSNIVHEMCCGCIHYEPVWMICKLTGKPCEQITKCEADI